MIPSEEGVFVFDKNIRQWRKACFEGPYVPKSDGVYLFYFRNFNCIGCKAFDRIWNEILKKYINEIHGELIMVQCTNFFYECRDSCASDTFVLFLVTATPQLLVVIVERGELRYVEREIGVLSIDKVLEFVNRARERMERYEKQAISEESKEEGVFIEFEGDWKKVVEKIRKLLFEGRNIREVCDESGCRLYVE